MSRKIPLVLCPGMLCDAALWAHQAEHMADIAEVLVADLTSQESIRAMAESVLMSAPPRFALAGLSMGGHVAQEVMRIAPERVIGLALLDTSARSDSTDQAKRRGDFLDLSERGRFLGVTAKLLPLLIHRDRVEQIEVDGIAIGDPVNPVNLLYFLNVNQIHRIYRTRDAGSINPDPG